MPKTKKQTEEEEPKEESDDEKEEETSKPEKKTIEKKDIKKELEIEMERIKSRLEVINAEETQKNFISVAPKKIETLETLFLNLKDRVEKLEEDFKLLISPSK